MGALRGPRRIKETRFHKLSSLFKLPMRRLADSRTDGPPQKSGPLAVSACAYRCERLDQLLEGAHNLSSNNSCRAFAHLASMALVNTPYEGTEPTIRNSRSVYCALTAIVKGEWPYPLPVELRRFTFAARRSSKRL